MKQVILSLNNSKNITKFLISVKSIWADKKQPTTPDVYSYEVQIDKKPVKYVFFLKKEVSKVKKVPEKLSINMTSDDETSSCLMMTFTNVKKSSTGFIGFKKSVIDFLGKGKCGLNSKNVHSEDIPGKYILKLANKLNIILDTEQSTLYDDARLSFCNDTLPLRLLYVLTHGKTWYDKQGGFSPEENIYKYHEEIKDMTLKQLFDSYYSNRAYKSRYESEYMPKLVKVLKKLKLTIDTSIPIPALTKKAFTELNDCDKIVFYNLIYSNILNDKTNKDKLYKSFMSFTGKFTGEFIKSTKKY